MTDPLSDADRARIRAEEVERLRVRAELAAEQKQARIRNEARGFFGAVNLFLKVMGW